MSCLSTITMLQTPMSHSRRMFYPGVETVRGASHLIVTAGFPTTLKPLRMRTLPLRTIKIKVIWPDGTSPEQSNRIVSTTSAIRSRP